MEKLRVASLFCGCGGTDVGLLGDFDFLGKHYASNSMEIVYANDIDDNACNIFKENFGIAPDNRDIREVKSEDIPEFDILTGGFPCQSFSIIAQNPKRLGVKDERGKLFFEMCRILKERQPKCFIAENVKGILTANKKSAFPLIMKEFEDSGYNVQYRILNSANYGVPQKRERVFFIGIKDDTDFEEAIWNQIFSQRRKAPTVRQLFSDLGPAGTDRNPQTCNAKITFAVKPVMRRIPYDCLMFNGIGCPIDPDGYSRTITASMGGNMMLIVDDVFLHDPTADNWIQGYYDKLVSHEIIPEFKEAPPRLRRLTINEARRLQTFPDDYIFCGSKTSVYKQIGNAVPCEMAKTVATAVVKYITVD